MNKLVVFATVLLLLFFPTHIFAQTESGWQISSFHADLAVQTDGSLQVTEQITADFDTQKHGIYRVIPYVYQTNPGSNVYTKIHIDRVLDNGQTVRFTISRDLKNITLKIGDPNQLVNGSQVYTIEYTVTGVIKPYQSYDELYWNVTGNAWPVPILSASATVTLPKPGILQASCYQGSYGSQTPCQTTKKADAVQFQTTQSLGADLGMTVAGGWKKGMVPILTVSWWQAYAGDWLTPLNLITFLLLTLGGSALVWWLWYKKGRDKWYRLPETVDPNQQATTEPLFAKDQIVVEFEPPEHLRPAEMGVLIDEKADTRDVTATIIDLATHGYLTITEQPKQWIFGSTNYLLNNTHKDTASLLPYEKLLLELLFGGADKVDLSQLQGGFYLNLQKTKNAIYQDVVAKQYFPIDPQTTRTKYRGFGLLLLFLAGILVFTGAKTGQSFFFVIAAGLVIPGILCIIVAPLMSSRTALGHDMYRRTKGYYLFISGAEKYRQQFFEKQNMFNETLPYAIMFGLTGKFAKAMKDMGVAPAQPTWYVGATPFNIETFGTQMNTFSSIMSTTMASAPSSSGSSGGGFSGGGFGGGGGGSW